MLELGLFETIIRVQRAFRGVGVLEFETDVSGEFGNGGITVLDTVLRSAFLDGPLTIFEGAIGAVIEGPYLQLPTGNVPIVFDPISQVMKNKLLLWSAPAVTDIVPEAVSSRFGTGRAMIFFNIGKILSKLKKTSFSFTLNTLDPHVTKAGTKIYYLKDPSRGTLDFEIAHPHIILDTQFLSYPSVPQDHPIYSPTIFATEEEATGWAARIRQVLNPSQTMAVEERTTSSETSNTVQWWARLTTYKKEKKDFPIGVDPPNIAAFEDLDHPAPGWDVYTDVNRVGFAMDVAGNHPPASNPIGNGPFPTKANTLTFTIQKDLTCKVVRT